MYWEIVNRAHAVGIDLGEASWILEDNEMMNRGAVVMGGDPYKNIESGNLIYNF